MDSLQIACFMAVAKTNSFSKAAKLLYKSQPVVSRQVISLENELGVKLFIRSARSVNLTEAGSIFKNRIEKISSDYSNLLETIRSTESGFSGELRIHVHSGHVYRETLIPIVDGFEKMYPDIRVMLYSAHSAEVKRLLSDVQTDFVYARWLDYSGIKDIEGKVVTGIAMGVLIPKTHPLAGNNERQASLFDFRDENFIVFPDTVSPGHARRLERTCFDSGFEPKFIYAPDTNTALLWMEAHRGISIVNQEHIFTRYSEFCFVELPELGTEEGAVIWNKNNENCSVALFREYLNNIYN